MKKISLETLLSVKQICGQIDKSILPHRNDFVENAIGHPVLNDLIHNIIQLQLKQNYLDQYFNIKQFAIMRTFKRN
ncbi:DUF1874 domain-containing protein [Candidatus Liberibacter asiaticus]|nr:DUF1874 domain-containing protein [Candidatus Liberibacter asiaticus]